MHEAHPVLIIEDDQMIGQSLSRALADVRLKVDWIRDGVRGQEAIERNHYSLVLLDLGLPLRSGFEVLRAIRDRGILTPLFIITAREEIDDRVAGLDLGADDYLVKPFSIKELIARIRGVLRRNGSLMVPAMSNGEITINLATLEANYRDKSRFLSARELALLHALMERPGMILSHSQLQQRLYGSSEEVASNVVEVLIHGLRKKFDREIIRNVRGIGWMVLRHPS
ncbi:MAG: response regulator transcription factor [Gallionella sp.]